MAYKELGIIAKKNSMTSTGWMYILPTCLDMNVKDMINNMHFSSNAKTVSNQDFLFILNIISNGVFKYRFLTIYQRTIFYM